VHRRQYRSIRIGEDVEVRRSQQAVACRNRRVVELGKARWAPGVGRPPARHAVIEARRGKPGYSVIPKPNLVEEPVADSGRSLRGGQKPLGCLIKHSTQRWGKPTHYKGKDLTEVRSPQRQLVPDTVGLDEHESTSLRGIALRALIGLTGQPVAKASTAEEPDAGKLHVRVWAGGAG